MGSVIQNLVVSPDDGDPSQASTRVRLKNPDGSVWSPAASGGGVTEQATSDATFYVSKAGNDSNSGLSWGSAKASVAAGLALLDGAGVGGTLNVGGGTYDTNTQLVVPNKVVVRGAGRDATRLRAGAGFPINTPLVRLGDPGVAQYAFGSRVENLTVDCNFLTGSLGVYSSNLQEMSGLSRVLVANFKAYGVHFGQGCDNWDVDNVEIYPADTGAQKGFFADQNYGQNSVRRVTIGVSGPLDVALHVKWGSVFAQSVHIEFATDGILFEAADGVAVGVSSGTASSNVTNLVRMDGSSRYVAVAGVTKNGATNTVVDDFFGKTVTDSFVQSMVMGDQNVARLNHYGDKVGFYGKAAVNKQTAVPVTAAGVHAALVNLGLIT